MKIPSGLNLLFQRISWAAIFILTAAPSFLAWAVGPELSNSGGCGTLNISFIRMECLLAIANLEDENFFLPAFRSFEYGVISFAILCGIRLAIGIIFVGNEKACLRHTASHINRYNRDLSLQRYFASSVFLFMLGFLSLTIPHVYFGGDDFYTRLVSSNFKLWIAGQIFVFCFFTRDLVESFLAIVTAVRLDHAKTKTWQLPAPGKWQIPEYWDE